MSDTYVKKGEDKRNITYFNELYGINELKFSNLTEILWFHHFILPWGELQRAINDAREAFINQLKICDKSHMTKIEIEPKLEWKSSERQINIGKNNVHENGEK